MKVLAAFISDVGLLSPHGLIHLNWLYEAWLGGKLTTEQGRLMMQFMNDNYIMEKHTITACAVWDTVSALGAPERYSWLPFIGGTKEDLSHVDHATPDNVQNVFHALALNERRDTFKPNVWKDTSKNTKHFKQCWFLGAHSDVGGGYEDIGLANITFIWMVAQLKKYTNLKFSGIALQKLLIPEDISEATVTYEHKLRGERSIKISGFESGLATQAAHGRKSPLFGALVTCTVLI